MLCAILVTLVNPDQPLTLAEVENRLTRNGYTESLIETGWAIQKGKAIVPILDKMLSNAKKYSDIGEFTGAFPFNAEYVLAHIDVPESLAALKKHKLKFGTRAGICGTPRRAKTTAWYAKRSASIPKPVQRSAPSSLLNRARASRS